jgi:hypothetical protein
VVVKYSLWNWVDDNRRWAYVTCGERREVQRLRRLLYAIAKPDCAFQIRKGGDPPDRPPHHVTTSGKPLPGFKAASRKWSSE